MHQLAPSILSADFANLARDVKACEDAGARYLHLDIMDGSFVPNLTFGPDTVKALRPLSNMVFDVHMMVDEPARFVEAFAKAGADIITVHAEATRHLDAALQAIHKAGCKAGVALNPATPLSALDWVLPQCDMVLLMSVNPGFGGQKFIPYTLDKVRALKQLCKERGLNPMIEIDGGVSPSNVAAILEAGVNITVAGSAVFKGDIMENVLNFAANMPGGKVSQDE